MTIILTIAVVALAFGGAWWIAGRIMGDEDHTEEEVQVFESSASVYIPRDAWEGFDKAHQHNPAKWAENDSWSPEFKVPANRA